MSLHIMKSENKKKTAKKDLKQKFKQNLNKSKIIIIPV